MITVNTEASLVKACEAVRGEADVFERRERRFALGGLFVYV
jgi:hypothetical protein